MKKVVLCAFAGASLLVLFSINPVFAEASGETARAASTPSGDATNETGEEAANNIVWGGEFNTHLQAEMNKPANTDAKGNLYDDSDLTMFANYSSWLSVNSDMKLERNRNDNLNDYYPDRNTVFRSEGLTLRQLYLTVRPVENL
ncbi:MAG TPA: hypothetical protein VFR09_08000, partial [Alphaproteobacteria bacterium]|nr:hypothetical protein [Alphaproteobacteria bacterium]